MNLFSLNKKNLAVTFLLLLLTLLTYSNSLNNSFIMDDYALIVRNRAIKDLNFLQLNLTDHVPSLTQGGQFLYYRPITHIFNLLTFLMFGYEPFGYHAFNLLLFFICAVSLYELLNKLFGDWKLSLLTSAFFSTHPINGVIVNYITMTGYAILIFSINFSLMAFLKTTEGLQKNFFLFLSLLWLGVALLCHETALSYPLYLAAVLYFVKRYNLKKTFLNCLPSLLMISLYLIFRLNYASLKEGVIDHIPYFQMSLTSFMASFFNLILFYVINLITLKYIVLIWASPLIKNNLLIWNISFFMILIMSLLLMFRYWHKDRRAFALSWFLIGLMPVMLASFSRPSLGFIIQPHWFFFSTIGFLMLTAILILNINTKGHQIIKVILIVFLLSSYIFASRFYNRLWSNEKKYCQYMYSLSPGMLLPTWWLGDIYLREKNFTKAQYFFEKTLRGNLSDWESYINLGVIASHLKDFSQAEKYFHKALFLNPHAAIAFNNLGALLMNRNGTQQAEKLFIQAIKEDHYLIEARKNLANLYRKQGKIDEAVALFKEVLTIAPNDTYSQKALQALSLSQN